LEAVGAARRAVGLLIALAGLAALVLGGALFLLSADLALDWEISRYALLLAFGGLAALLAGRFVRGTDRGLESLAEEGLDGRATTGELTDTGRRGSRTRALTLDLVVDVPGRPPYPVIKRASVPEDLVAWLEVGRELPVKVDPTDPQRVGIDLVALRAEAAAGSSTPSPIG